MDTITQRDHSHFLRSQVLMSVRLLPTGSGMDRGQEARRTDDT